MSEVSPTVANTTFSNLPGYCFVGAQPFYRDKLQFIAARLVQGVPLAELYVVADLFLEAIVGCKKDNEFSVLKVMYHLELALQKSINRQRRQYRCFFLTDLPSSFLVNIQRPHFGIKLRRCEWDEAKAVLGGDPGKVWNKDRSRIEPSDAYLYRVAQIDVQARDTEEAHTLAWEGFSFVRSIANWANSIVSNTVVFQHTTLPSAARFKESPLMAVRSHEDEPLNVELLLDFNGKSEDELNWRGLDHAKFVLNAFPNDASTVPTSVARLYRAFQLFGLALDQTDPSAQFMRLWQTIEMLVNPTNRGGKSGDTTLICTRVANLFLNPESIRPYLEAMAPIRNRLVHDGEFVDEFEAASYWMREIAKETLRRFTILSENFPTDDYFKEYFELITCGNNILRTDTRDSEARNQVKIYIKKSRIRLGRSHPPEAARCKPPGL